jgi:plasmid stabilization system protein ParE
MKLRFTPRAIQDLINIADYIRERNPAASMRVRAAILNSLQNLMLSHRKSVGDKRWKECASSSPEGIRTSSTTPSTEQLTKSLS